MAVGDGGQMANDGEGGLLMELKFDEIRKDEIRKDYNRQEQKKRTTTERKLVAEDKESPVMSGDAVFRTKT